VSPNRSFWIKWIWEKKFISSCRIIYKAKNKETSPCKFLIYFYFSYPVRSSSISLGTAIVSLRFYRVWKIFNENAIYFSAFKLWNVFKLHFLECTVTRRQGKAIILSPKSRKQYEDIYIQVKVCFLGVTTHCGCIFTAR